MGRIIRFEPLAPVGETLQASVDLANLAGHIATMADRLKDHAATLFEAHGLNEPATVETLHAIRRDAGNVFVALAEHQFNTALKAAREQCTDALGARAVADALNDLVNGPALHSDAPGG